MDSDIEKAISYSIGKLGYPSIRKHQHDIMYSLLSGKQCLLVSPTGSGKSYIFEGVGFAKEYLLSKGNKDKRTVTIVLSPLIALMKLQVKKLKGKGIAAAYLKVNL